MLVPDSPDAFTSENGWKLDMAQHRLVGAALNELKPLGCRVILFVNRDPAALAPVHNIGADGIEIYTGSYAVAFRTGSPDTLRQACAATDPAPPMWRAIRG
jgi:pyridoxine 5-phosphate synthase